MCGSDCQAKKKNKRSRSYGLFSGLLLLIIPKCPFCFMAFSSALLICSDNGIDHSSRTFYSTTTLILTALFSILALFSIFLNLRPGRGVYSLLLAGLGNIAILFSVTTGGGLTLYYSGAFLVLAGVVLNSGLWLLLVRMISFHKKHAF